MSTALDELFMAEAMTGAVRRFADQSEERNFISVYEAGEKLMPLTDVVKWDEVRFSRDLAPVTGPSSPSKATKPLSIIKRTGEVYAVKEHVDLDGRLLKMARGEGSMMPDPAGYLNANLLNLTNRVQRTRNYWAQKSMLTTTGVVDLSAFPNSDLSAGSTMTYPVATANAANSWALASTKIRSAEINALKLAYKQNTGINPGVAIASDDVEGYITGNSEISNPVDNVQTLAQRKVETSYLEGGSLLRFGGLDWRFARDQYYADSAPDTAVNIAAATDLVAVLPPAARFNEAFAIAEGIQLIPTGAISTLATGNPFSLIAEVRGFFAYLELITNPIGLRLHVGWCGLLIQKMQKGVLVFNAIP